MKRSSVLTLTAIFICLGLILWWLGAHRPISESLTAHSDLPSQFNHQAVIGLETSQDTLAVDTELRALYTSVTTEKIRSQVGADPHETPAGMNDFANGLALLIRPALQNSQGAELLSKLLEPCVADPSLDLVESARALCLINMQRLSNAFPGNSRMESRLETISNQAPERVRAIAKAVSQYGSH